jgi:hypothetical protein
LSEAIREVIVKVSDERIVAVVHEPSGGAFTCPGEREGEREGRRLLKHAGNKGGGK